MLTARPPHASSRNRERRSWADREMDIRGGSFNSPVVLGVTDQHRRYPGRPGRLHVQGGVAHIPDRRIGGARPSCASASCSGAGSGLSAVASPAPMTGPKIAVQPRCVTSRRRNAPALLETTPCGHAAPASRTSGTPGIGVDMIQMLCGQGLVEHVAGMFPSVAEHDREALAQGDAHPVARVLDGPERMAKPAKTALSAAVIPAQPSTRVLSQSYNRTEGRSPLSMPRPCAPSDPRPSRPASDRLALAPEGTSWRIRLRSARKIWLWTDTLHPPARERGCGQPSGS